MYPRASIVGGFLATLGVISLAISGPASVKLISSALSEMPSTGDQLDRAHKGDRLGTLAAQQPPSTVTTVEVVGVRDTQIVYRDRGGRVLFRTDPLANMTVVAKDVSLPAVTVREHSDAVPSTLPIKTLQQGEQTEPAKAREENKPRRLEGCDPMVSPLANSALSQVAGRCIAGLAGAQKVALAAR